MPRRIHRNVSRTGIVIRDVKIARGVKYQGYRITDAAGYGSERRRAARRVNRYDAFGVVRSICDKEVARSVECDRERIVGPKIIRFLAVALPGG